MNFFRVSIVDFFGILCPGVLMAINLSLLMISFNIGYKPILDYIIKSEIGSTLFILLFVTC